MKSSVLILSIAVFGFSIMARAGQNDPQNSSSVELVVLNCDGQHEANPNYSIILLLQKQGNEVTRGLLQSTFQGPHGLPHRLPLIPVGQTSNQMSFTVNHQWLVQVATDVSSAEIFQGDNIKLYDCHL